VEGKGNSLILKPKMFRNLFKPKAKSVSPGKIAWQRFRRNKIAMSGFYFIIFTCLVAIFGNFIRPDASADANMMNLPISNQKPGFKVNVFKQYFDQKQEQNFLHRYWMGKNIPYKEIAVQQAEIKNDSLHFIPFFGFDAEELPPLTLHLSELHLQNVNDISEVLYKKTFLLGTDKYGRDMLSRLMAGTRISLSVGLIAVILSLIIGITLGAVSGYFKGRIDTFIVWLINVVWSIPTLLLVIAITLVLGKGFWQIFVAVGLTMWVEVARVVRGQVLGLREKEFIEAGKALGFKNYRIIMRHVVPNILGPVIVISAGNFASAILIEAGLSFLGIGAQPPLASWGGMIKEHYGYIIMDGAYLALIPGIAIMLLVLAFMLVGNGLRDALDTKQVEMGKI
jgi:peptide/nickel transport system permease protein